MDKSEQILELMAEMRTETAGIRTEMADMRTETAGIRNDMRTEITGIRTDMAEIRTDMQDGFNRVYSTMQEEFNNVYAEFKDIQMTLENETNKNIQLIAEGHFNLNRKLDDALKVESEKELMLIRLTRLENEVRRLKARIEEIA